ncbi:MAG: hypothetical protein LBQ54_01995 [Planctomycetaceae bacterium]|jgi:hypothetical protein|nr:hypothetical protein [Planctomycetaceae bacterium]
MISTVIFAVTGCTTSLCKKRGVLFRGDWAFEINRTPWVGCPADADSENESKSCFSFLKKEKEGDSEKKGGKLLNRIKCEHGNPSQNCSQCYMFHQGIAPYYNYGNPMQGEGFSMANLPEGSMVVQNGIVLPNGVFVPNTAMIPPETGNAGGINGIGNSNGNMGNVPPLEGNNGGNNGNNSHSDNGNNKRNAAVNSSGTIRENGYAVLSPGNGNVLSITPTGNGMMAVVATDGTVRQIPMSPNGMLINPAANQVIPGLSMSGYAAPGYPPIAYSPTGYSPGQAQPYQLSQSDATLDNTGQQGKNGTSKEPSAEETQANMPYPRFSPVPSHPVFQRSMGMAPNYQAMVPPMVMPPGYSPYPVYPPALMPQVNPVPLKGNSVLQQQRLYQAKLQEQAKQRNLTSQNAQNSHIILASQQTQTKY